MPNIYDFLDEPFETVRKGYPLSYMNCVSCMSQQWGVMTKLTFGEFMEFKNILDMTIREIIWQSMSCFFKILAVVTFPVGVWFWGWVQYMSIKTQVKP